MSSIRDALSPLEREALNAMKHQRRAAVASSAPAAASSNGERLMLGGNFRSFAAEDVSLRRGVERVLEKEAQLLEIRVHHATEDLEELRRKVFGLQLKHDRLLHVIQVTVPQKKAAVESLRASIGAIEETRLSKVNDKKMLLLSSAVRELVSSEGPTSRSSTNDDSVSAFVARAWLSSDRSAANARATLATLMSASSHRGDDNTVNQNDNDVDGDRVNQKLDGGVSGVEGIRAAIERETLRRAVREMFDLCAESSMPNQSSSWYRIASDTVALQTKLSMDQEDFPKYEAMKESLEREAASRSSLRAEQERQLQVAHDRLEEAHRAAFQNRKNMIALHRRLVNDHSEATAAKSKTQLESIRNELAMGKVDLLRALCNDGHGVPPPAIPTAHHHNGPSFAAATTASASRLTSVVPGGAVGGRGSEKFQQSGTFTPVW
jgi:hypothetical protein